MKIRKRLKPGAVPTVFHRPSTATQVREQEKVSVLQKRASSSIEGNGAHKKTKRRERDIRYANYLRKYRYNHTIIDCTGDACYSIKL